MIFYGEYVKNFNYFSEKLSQGKINVTVNFY